jgi:hypothetical protein
MMQTKIASQDKTIKKTGCCSAQAQSSYQTLRLPPRYQNQPSSRQSIAAIPAESIPFIGVAVLLADTGYELYAA